ncbi:MAG: HD domain-containing protein [Nitrospirae bacterium]|nr:HD domain-containing protein [Nitrospirota bacterium]
MPMTPRFAEAFLFAERLHCTQVRKKTQVPTISHLMAVAALVLENGGDEDEAMAALLHDTAEDCGGRPVLDEIRRRFGGSVASIVEGCSDTLESPKPRWKPRKESYLEHLETAPEAHLLVSLADKVHNARSLAFEYRRVGDDLWQRFSASQEQTMWYYESLLAIFRRRCPEEHRLLVNELAKALRDLKTQVRRGAAT